MAKTIGLIRTATYGFTQCATCGYRKEWHAVNAKTQEPTDITIYNVIAWAEKAEWTRNARKQWVCPRCSQGKPPIKTVEDVVTLLGELTETLKAHGVSTEAATARIRSQLAYPDADVDIASLSRGIMALADVTQVDSDLPDNGDDRYNFDDDDPDGDAELEAAVSAAMPRLTEKQAMVYVYRMMAAAQKARSIFAENNGDPDEDPAAKYIAEQISPWLFGPKCILIGLQRVIESHENGIPLEPSSFYNLVDIATRREVGISIAAQLPFMQPETSWLQGWLPDDETQKED